MAAGQQSLQRQHQAMDRRVQELAHLQELLCRAQLYKTQQAEHALQAAAALAQSLNPYGVLARGYTIATCGDEVKAVEALHPGQAFTLRGAHAEADCTVQSVRKITQQGSDGR